MNKVSFFLLAFTGFVAFGQQNKIVFTKKLQYEFIQKTDQQKIPMLSLETLTVEMLTNNKEALVTIPKSIGGSSVYFADDQNVSSVKIGLNNQLKSEHNQYAMLNSLYAEEIDNGNQKFSIIPLQQKESILGYSCDQFLLKPIFGISNTNKSGDDHIKLCLNTTSGINNASTVASVFKDQFRVDTVEPLKGLILKVGQANQYDSIHFVMTKVENTKDFVFFNHQDAISESKKLKESLRIKFEDEKKNNPLFVGDNSSDSLTEDYSIMDMYGENIDESQKYISNYKSPAEDIGILAIHNLKPDSKVWTVLPDHCKDIEKNLPTFDNKDLRKRVGNYTGQLCDLYLTQLDFHSVAVKETIDEFRREGFDFLYDFENLSKKDRQKLIQYLKKLD